MNSVPIRIIDFVFALIGLILTSPLLISVVVAGYFDTGHPIFFQKRVGRNQRAFTLIKFRTMPMQTKSVASHLVDASAITKFGILLRKTKIDELPQLINVIRGDMSLVGPRPNLFNQKELMEKREDHGVYAVLPGITGLAQISKIDMSTPLLLARTDQIMISSFTLRNYFKYLVMTVIGKGSGDAIKS